MRIVAHCAEQKNDQRHARPGPGKGRRSRIDDYRITKRGGLGIRNYSNGNVAGIKIVDDTDDLILISQNGILIRIHAADINVQSRYGSGVRVMRLVEDDKVAVVARVDRDNDAETAKIEDTGDEYGGYCYCDNCQKQFRV